MTSCPSSLSIAMRPGDLRCDHLPAPLCVGSVAPRLSWLGRHPEFGQVQSAYQVLVASDRALLEEGCGDLWNSGQVAGSDPFVLYAGISLQSGQQCYWQVRIWDSQGRVSAYSDIARFGIGLLTPQAWAAEWIAPAAPQRGVSPLLRTTVALDKPVTCAVAYLCGLGYSEFSVNGEKVGDAVLDPGFTDYTKRVLYTAHDITAFLHVGENALGVMLGEGWLGNDHASFVKNLQRPLHWISDPCLLLQIHLTFADGSSIRITSTADGSWQCCDGPIIENNLFDGETYDARLAQPGWDMPDFVPDPARGWTPAVTATPLRGMLVPQMMEPIRVMQEMRPLMMTRPREGIYVIDIGQNIAGWVRLAVQGPAGTEVMLKYAEILDAQGMVNQEPLRAARATDRYILCGDGVECYQPRFTYHGFRYVQIEGYPGIPSLDDLTACVVRSATALTGYFSCSHPLLNQIQQAVQWTEADNMHSILTDCPQRDERQGWLNDATVRLDEAMYNFTLPALLAKWEDDIADTMTSEGAILDTAPYINGPENRADAVCSSYLLIPWLSYLHYGDRRILECHYDELKRWTDYLARQTEDGIVTYSHYGDWASPVAHCFENNSANSKETPGPLMSTGYLYYNASLIARIAEIIGKEADVPCYTALAEATKAAFLREFYHPETATFAQGSQASQVFPLYLGMVPEADRGAVIAHAAQDVIARDYHLTTGNLCTKYLLEMLTEYGYVEVAYRLATQTSYPSWGYMMAHGATTIWERWELGIGADMNSHNHPMYATISSWFFKYLAGVRIDASVPGAGHLRIQPYFPADVRFVNAKIGTVRGDVVSRWMREAEMIRLEVTVPFNATATIALPDGVSPHLVGSGTHTLHMPIQVYQSIGG